MSQKILTLPKGVRDFSPVEMRKRNYIFDILKTTFEKYSFLPLATPALENLSVLMGKYGAEGDQLLFKILNSGDFLSDIAPQDFDKNYAAVWPKIANKGLKYDLTVPLARYVAMHRNELTLPFRRYQMQPVWRADRPQKGRYREFFQCDIDIIGTHSLFCEADIIAIIYEVFQQLGIIGFTIQLNHRKILTGIAEWMGELDKEQVLCIAIDKLEKVGQEKVFQELKNKKFLLQRSKS